MLEVITLAVLTDNYIYVIHDSVSQETAVVDPALAEPVLDLLRQKGWQLTYIFNTHHHWDHVGGNLELKEKTGCKIIAGEYDKHRIPGIDQLVNEGQNLTLGQHLVKVFFTPGHTLGHIVYYFVDDNLLFCGDTLFVMGCGRLFEGSAEQMWHSLQKLKVLPTCTKIYCTHEYTQANGRFALTIEPENKALKQRMHSVDELRSQNRPTVPSTIAEELATNPFFREDSPNLQRTVGMINALPIPVFAKVRLLKDKY